MANYRIQNSYDLDYSPPGPFNVGNNTGYLGKTSPVGAYSANNYGLYDMHGNVFEWYSDRYAENYGSTNASDPATDPNGPETDYNHVVRGGCWNYSAQDCRSASRRSVVNSRADNLIGFRVVFVP